MHLFIRIKGVHYTSPRFQKLLKKYKLDNLCLGRGNCWDNAPQESFFGHMKDEIDYKSCNTFNELQIIMDDYMDYYNNYRYQWNLKKLTPVQYRNQLLGVLAIFFSNVLDIGSILIGVSPFLHIKIL